ncbi:glycosyltransferase family 39 protein [Lewinella sp. W8]|uniref:ArnT family glycosyltransferase n=1 Tax=Lewinella sp. W8 TaxID=2528208 RepID=UPI0011013F9D|nr:glycosyltransferase family 39 protein [Lewinella sp. W8]
MLLPALLINLGVVVFIDDEAIRSLVAQEMIWSGNWIAPTMHGDAYLNKPPLWNWLVALSFLAHGGASEWAARLPTVLALLGFGATTFFFSSKYFSRHTALLHALMVVTCGRMLFWDSLLALIDVTLSWVVYTQIMLLYHYGRQGKWWRAFGWSYALTAAGFMLKGLPAIVFQGLTVLTILWWTKQWRQFFRAAHLLSGLGCLALLGLYYWRYSNYVDLSWVAERLFIESGKRTAMAQGLGASLRHLVEFPLEMSYHFLPWTILLLLFFRKGSWTALKTNDFAAFTLVAFLVNIPVYWLSPNVYPRYLLMLFPLLFGSLIFLYSREEEKDTQVYRGFRWLFLGLMAICALVIPLIPLIPDTEMVSHAWWKSFVLGVTAGAVWWLGWRSPRDTVLAFAVMLLVIRIVFNVFVLPPRAAGDERGNAVRDTAHAVVDQHESQRMAIYGFTLIEPATGYYLSIRRGRIIPRQWEKFDDTTAYIVSPLQYPDLEVSATDSLYLRHLRVNYPVGRLPDPPAGRAALNGVLRDGMGAGIPVRATE